jgi:predicted nucleotidyltransferase component of viral defense system
MLNKDYRKLYQIQDKILLALKPVLSSFYLTGGTALGRFYLNHRFSEDLDFFMNKSNAFKSTTKNIEKVLLRDFSVLKQQSLIYDDFVRYYIEEGESVLKVEFVNDIEYRCGVPNLYEYGLIDTPLNMLTNKITAIVGRDEPKDIFDIYTLAQNYKFNWLEVFEEVKNKAIINEIDVEQRIKNFPALLFQEVDWQILPPDIEIFSKGMATLADDFFLGQANSLGFNKPLLQDARVLKIK